MIDVVSRSSFDVFDHVYVGHYHNEQRLNDKIQYIGSTLSHNFGDKRSTGIYMINVDGTLTLLPTKYPEHKTITVSSQSEIDDVLDSILPDNQDNIKIVFEGDKKIAAMIDRSPFSELNNVQLKVKALNKIVEDDSSEHSIDNISLNNDAILRLFYDFCELNNHDAQSHIEPLKSKLNVKR
jgi:DNA repair exonuclease SbcCD nuclease subunit